MALSSYQINKHSFVSSLSDYHKSCLESIPDSVYVAFKAFSGLSFSVDDIPMISSDFPWRYLHNLDYDKHDIYSIPMSMTYFFKHGFLDFSLHPFFKYDCIFELSFLYDDFINKSVSSSVVSAVVDFFNLKLISQYECV